MVSAFVVVGVMATHRVEGQAIAIAGMENPMPTSMMVSGHMWLAKRKSSLRTAMDECDNWLLWVVYMSSIVA